jgi:hypothetical protein
VFPFHGSPDHAFDLEPSLCVVQHDILLFAPRTFTETAMKKEKARNEFIPGFGLFASSLYVVAAAIREAGAPRNRITPALVVPHDPTSANRPAINANGIHFHLYRA